MRFRLTPPTLITLLRIVAAPWIGYELARANFKVALPALFVAGCSDWLDGYLARRFHWQSELGEKLDPLADKVLVATVYICFVWRGILPWWVTAIVLGRDALILLFALAALATHRARRFPPSRWGKYSTFCQLMLGGGGVIQSGWPAFLPAPTIPVAIAITVAATVWSGLHYAWLGWRMAHESSVAAPAPR
jgi:cardiolipin synthase